MVCAQQQKMKKEQALLMIKVGNDRFSRVHVHKQQVVV